MLFLSCSIRRNAPLPFLALASHEPFMEFGGALSMVDGLAVAGGTGSSEGGSLLSRSLTTSSGTTEPCCKPKGLLGCAFQRASEAMVPPFDSLFPDGEQMLSFSATSKQDSFVLSCDGALPSYYPSPPSPSPKPYLWNPGLYSGCHDVSSNGVLAEGKGPFTPSQWLELENQALVYRYIAAKVPIPHNLLNPIKRSLGISGLPHFSVGSFGSSAFGWGSFYLGYSGNNDPEPGRCRRTDGKKWRCSRDAVADQKYCERHINRGRHRSRKHVEGQSSRAAKAMPVVPLSRSASSTVSGGESTSGLGVPQSQTTINLATSEPSPAPFNTKPLSKEDAKDDGHEAANLSISASMSSKAMTSMPISRKQSGEFQLVSTGSHFNPESSSLSDINLLPSSLKLDVLRPQSNPLHHFIDDWPQTRPHHSTVTWPEIEDMQSERTQLSMSISMASSEFSSSTNHDTDTLSPLKLSREYDLARLDSQSCRISEGNQRQASWIPISWGASMGGPLGEALKNTNNSTKDQSKTCSSSSSLNILTGCWDSSPQLESSSTGILQKTSFGSLTSSTGSSRRIENKKTNESTGSLCNNLLGPTIP
ncbi:growth-regulating factor 7-like [Curcuma longa]|uniref:growth-regulating factor 7-like n=1 Tax=Curcuma longa TaxID=136217 RepID=UPI003D9FA3BB